MKKLLKKNFRKGERGNVLFLILIAVALFAALSYAVTSSSRSGGGDANSETNLISSAQLTQYPASVRTAIVRMIISSNTPVDELEFNPPNDFANLTDLDAGAGTNYGYGVFHPDGGGAVFAPVPPDVMAGSNQGNWTFNGDFEIVNIGTSSAGSSDGNEVIAFLAGISPSVCNKINDKLGIPNIPVITASIEGADAATLGYARMMDNGLSIHTTEIVLGTGGAAGSNIADLDGQPYACFRNTATGDYVYYHVLVER